MHTRAIRNVRIVDGDGGAAFEGDLAIDEGRISAIGSVGAARDDIDGQGRVLAPGFIDVHSHDDGALLRHPDMWFKVNQGITTVVTGNCGFSAVACGPSHGTASVLFLDRSWHDLEDYRDTVAAHPPTINAMPLIGHNTVREAVMGLEERPTTAAELDRMRALVRVAMEQGACGFSAGLLYAPGKWAPHEELAAVAGEAAPYGGVFTCHIRDEFDELLPSVQEALDVGAAASVGVQISHHKAAKRGNWGMVTESLARIDEAVASGRDVTLDAYPYTAGSGPMAQYFRDGIDQEFAEATQLASCPSFPEYDGRRLTEIAETEGRTLEETIRRILDAPGGEDTVCLQFLTHEDDIVTNMRHPRVMIGSDGIPKLDGRPHPRLVATFPRVLGRYVREQSLVPLEEMVRRMTSLAADRFGLTGRGRIAEGNHADLVLFDPDTVIDAATYEQPLQVSPGIERVLVGGAVVWDGERTTDARPGQVLRFQRD